MDGNQEMHEESTHFGQSLYGNVAEPAIIEQQTSGLLHTTVNHGLNTLTSPFDPTGLGDADIRDTSSYDNGYVDAQDIDAYLPPGHGTDFTGLQGSAPCAVTTNEDELMVSSYPLAGIDIPRMTIEAADEDVSVRNFANLLSNNQRRHCSNSPDSSSSTEREQPYNTGRISKNIIAHADGSASFMLSAPLREVTKKASENKVTKDQSSQKIESRHFRQETIQTPLTGTQLHSIRPQSIEAASTVAQEFGIDIIQREIGEVSRGTTVRAGKLTCTANQDLDENVLPHAGPSIGPTNTASLGSESNPIRRKARSPPIFGTGLKNRLARSNNMVNLISSSPLSEISDQGLENLEKDVQTLRNDRNDALQDAQSGVHSATANQNAHQETPLASDTGRVQLNFSSPAGRGSYLAATLYSGIESSPRFDPDALHRLLDEKGNAEFDTSLEDESAVAFEQSHINNTATDFTQRFGLSRAVSPQVSSYDANNVVHRNQDRLEMRSSPPAAAQAQVFAAQVDRRDSEGAVMPNFTVLAEPSGGQCQPLGLQSMLHGCQTQRYHARSGQVCFRHLTSREAALLSVANLNRIILANTSTGTTSTPVDQSNATAAPYGDANTSSSNTMEQTDPSSGYIVAPVQRPHTSQNGISAEAQAARPSSTRRKVRTARYSSTVLKNEAAFPPHVQQENLPYGIFQPPSFTNSADAQVVDYYMKRQHGGRPRKANPGESADVITTRLVNMESKRASRDREQAIKDRDRARQLMLDKLMMQGAQGFRNWLLTSSTPRKSVQRSPVARDSFGCYVDERSLKVMTSAGVATGQYAGTLDGSAVPIASVTFGGSLLGGYLSPAHGPYESPYPPLGNFLPPVMIFSGDPFSSTHHHNENY